MSFRFTLALLRLDSVKLTFPWLRFSSFFYDYIDKKVLFRFFFCIFANIINHRIELTLCLRI